MSLVEGRSRSSQEKEGTMSTDKKTETPKQPPKSADELAKTKKKGDVELSEEELKRTTGGAFEAYNKMKF
jgi:hypothetical protein